MIRKKYITYTSNKTALAAAFAAADPDNNWHEMIGDEINYKNFHKHKTFSSGTKSFTIMKILDHYQETFLQPLVDGGFLECLGAVDGLACDFDSPESGLSEEDWTKIREIAPELGTELEGTDLNGNTFTYSIGFIDVA